MSNNIVKWRCTKCGDVIESDKTERHTMDWCECGEAFVDAAEHYSRANFYVEFYDDETGKWDGVNWP